MVDLFTSDAKIKVIEVSTPDNLESLFEDWMTENDSAVVNRIDSHVALDEHGALYALIIYYY